MMNSRVLFLIFALSFTFHSFLVYADEEHWHHIEFPKTIETNQTITSLPEGWIAGSSPTIHHITEVDVFDGHPSDRAVLKPDNPGDKETVWTSLRETDAVWLSLSYSNTCVVIQKKLPQKITAIKIIYERKGIESILYRL